MESVAANSQRTSTVCSLSDVLARARQWRAHPVRPVAAKGGTESAPADAAHWAEPRWGLNYQSELVDEALDTARGDMDKAGLQIEPQPVPILVAPGQDNGPRYRLEIKTPFSPRRVVEIRAANSTHAYRYARSRGFSVLSVAEEPTTSVQPTEQGKR